MKARAIEDNTRLLKHEKGVEEAVTVVDEKIAACIDKNDWNRAIRRF